MSTQILNYKITWDELELEGQGKIPGPLKPVLQELHDNAKNGNPKVIGRLRKLIKEYPSVPALKNYLTTAYETMGKHKKALQVNDQILNENPDYLFAKANKAGQHFQDGEYEEMPVLLGKSFDLQMLYPDRDIFHISEFMAMQGMAVRYFSATGKLEEAKKRLELMNELDKDNPQCDLAENIYHLANVKEGLRRFAKEKEERITPDNQFHLKRTEFKRPESNIAVTNELYQYDLDIPDSILKKFFNHDRDQVIEDLENVLKDSYFNYNPLKSNDYSEESCAPIHSFFLLGDLEAEESLPVAL